MQLAQRLYEGVDIGGETVGLITYMRTDGVQMAAEAIAGAREVIAEDFGKAYVPEAPRLYKTKAKNAQEAHEAIRPTTLARRPDDVARYLDSEFTGGRLFPARVDGLQDLMIQHLEEEVESLTFKLQDPFYIDSISDLVERTMIIRHKERKFGKGCLQQWKREHSQLMKEAEVLLHPYEKMLQHSDFLLSDQPVYSDFLLAGILGNITFHGYVSIPESLPRLRELPDRLEVHLLQ